MKKMMIGTAAAAMAVFAPGLAHAGGYVGLGYSHIDGDGAAVGGVTGRAGWRGESNFGVEGEFSVGVKDDEVSGVKLELDNGYGVYVVGFLPAGENTDFFGRLGYASHEISGSLGPVSVSVDVNGISGGIGVQHFFGGGNFGVRGEYTRSEGDDGGMDVFGVSGVLRF